jgi:hypothetical protein
MRVLVIDEHAGLGETLGVGVRGHQVAVEVGFDGPRGAVQRRVRRPGVMSIRT